ncbi:hypothetical protein ACJX0J_031276, partial [Zea mays]
ENILELNWSNLDLTCFQFYREMRAETILKISHFLCLVELYLFSIENPVAGPVHIGLSPVEGHSFTIKKFQEVKVLFYSNMNLNLKKIKRKSTLATDMHHFSFSSST